MASVEESEPRRPEILEALGCRVYKLARIVAKNARRVPIVGKSVGFIDDTISPWLEPVISHVVNDVLYVLSLVDNKIHTVSDIAMAYVPFAATFVPQLQAILSGQPIDSALMVLDSVRSRGVVGSTADVWVDYEPIMKSESDKIYGFVIRLPGVHVVISILNNISKPFVSFATDWLVTECKDKHEISSEVLPSYLDSPFTPRRTDEPDFNALAAESDSELDNSCDPSSTERVESTEVAQVSKEAISAVPVIEVTSASTDVKGKLTVVDEDEEEKDELTLLFDTWGMGVEAITPRVNSLRSMSLHEESGAKKAISKPFSRSSRY